ncbi:hypothetical protein AB0J21_31005 [Streptomyces sp. NPDC049954]|uniref:hypothetical protein n=1 Tax=Streptomyces sp. NPDC049954 TaxID=3155779 RepID=UPI00341476F1
MHRTKTTAAAALLVTMAVSALSGCVSVRPPAPPDAKGPAVPPRASAPPAPLTFSGPFQEVLLLLDGAGPRPAGPVPLEEEETRQWLARPEAGHGGAGEPAAPPGSPAPAPRPARTAVPAPAGPAPAVVPPAVRELQRPRPPHPAPAPRAGGDGGRPEGGGGGVCGLGRTYGGWPADSPQARICGQTYGR